MIEPTRPAVQSGAVTATPLAPRWRRLMLAAAVAGSVATLPSCSAWSWTKDKLGYGPPPAAEFPPPPAPMPAAAPAPVPAPAPAEPALPPPPTPIAAPPPVAASPLPPPVAAAPAFTPSAAVAAPAADLRRGRYAVQVGVFLVATNAETIRSRVASQLADSGFDGDDAGVRVVKKGERTYVVVGDAPDRRAAEALAERVRAALRQDVVVFQR